LSVHYTTHLDTPFPIDPFNFVSTCIEDSRTGTKAGLLSDGVFAVPSLPDRLNVHNNGTINVSAAPTASVANSVSMSTKMPAPTPKTTFPDAHLSFLIEKITALQATSLTFLVDSIHRDLTAHKVKKNAIESKIKEVGEKCKEKKIWVIKSKAQVSCRLFL
jgi:chromatin assembly factor 1 subunit A